MSDAAGGMCSNTQPLTDDVVLTPLSALTGGGRLIEPGEGGVWAASSICHLLILGLGYYSLR